MLIDLGLIFVVNEEYSLLLAKPCTEQEAQDIKENWEY
jgi:hypothetical protein